MNQPGESGCKWLTASGEIFSPVGTKLLSDNCSNTVPSLPITSACASSAIDRTVTEASNVETLTTAFKTPIAEPDASGTIGRAISSASTPALSS